jgi:ribosomal protein L11 methyltransferase
LADSGRRADHPALDLRFAAGPDSASLEARLYAVLDDFEPIAIQEHESAGGWLVFFREASQRDEAARALRQLDLPSHSVTSVAVPDEDWARRSQAGLTAITVGRITIAPPWDVPPDPVPPAHQISAREDDGSPTPDHGKDHIVIIIDPSMGFGTGHHQTTRLCLRLLQAIDLAGRRVIDIGTGSGVLAIAADRLGASSVVAIDNDPDALRNARENIERNRAGVEAVQADVRNFSAAPADVVIANLTAGVLQQHATALRALAAPDASLIVSGFSPEELPDVTNAFDARVVRHVIEGEWTAAVIET